MIDTYAYLTALMTTSTQCSTQSTLRESSQEFKQLTLFCNGNPSSEEPLNAVVINVPLFVHHGEILFWCSRDTIIK